MHGILTGQAGGVLNALAQMTSQLNSLHLLEVPTVLEAVALHEAAHGPLTRESTYGVDPIHASSHLQALRERDFKSAYPSFEAIFSTFYTTMAPYFGRPYCCSLHCLYVFQNFCCSPCNLAF